MSRTTLTPKLCGLLWIETTEDSSDKYFPLSQTIGAEYVSLFATSRTIADFSGRCYLLSRTMRDQSVFLFSMSNWLSDRCPYRGVLHTPLNHSRKGYLIARQTIVGRMQYVTTLPKKDEVSSGRCFLLFRIIRDKSVFHSSMSNRLSDRDPCRGVLHTPHIDSTSTLSPLAGRLVGRMQYAPTFPEKDKVSSGKCFLSSQTMGDQSVFLFSMSNRLSDGYPGRGVLHTLHIDSTSIPPPLTGCLVGRIQYAHTLSEKKIGFEWLVWGYVWDNQKFFDKENEKRKDFLAGG